MAICETNLNGLGAVYILRQIQVGYEDKNTGSLQRAESCQLLVGCMGAFGIKGMGVSLKISIIRFAVKGKNVAGFIQ